MTEPQDPDRGSRFSIDAQHKRQAEKAWRTAGYSGSMIERLRWNSRYSIVQVGAAAFAFSGYSEYVAALRDAWAAHVVPGHGASFVRGIDLPAATNSLRGVDVDLSQTHPDWQSGDHA